MAKRASHWTLSLAGTFTPIPVTTTRPTSLRLPLLLLPLPLYHSPPKPKPFTTTSTRPKKSRTLAKQIQQSNDPSSTNTNTTTTTPSPMSVDASDFTAYDLAIATAHDRLRSETAKIRASVSGGGGGSSAGEAIENIRLPRTSTSSSSSSSGNKNKNKTRRAEAEGEEQEATVISDVASVIPRGRNISLLVSEAKWVRPVTSALQAHPLPNTSSPSSSSSNFTPQAVPGEDALHLSVSIPPVTRETREMAAKRVKEKGEEALFALREARGACKKRLRGLGLGRKVGPDELRRAEREMERRNEEAGRVVAEVVGVARKGCEGG